jgi:DNA repair exonuclease SbcCD ATPase subunit
VIDQKSFDDLAARLQSLLTETAAASLRLQKLLDSAGRAGESPSRASAQLQERLRLGARMLKAFQTQIDRVEASLARLDEHHEQIEYAGGKLEQRFQQMEALAEEKLEHARGLLAESSKKAVAAFDQETQAGSNAVAALLDRTQALEKQLNDFQQRLESSEADALARARRIDETLNAIDARIERVGELIERCDATDCSLRDRCHELRAVAGQIEEQVLTSQSALSCLIEEGLAVRATIESALEQVQKQTEAVGRHRAAASQLEATLKALRPWQPLLLQAEAGRDGVPKPVVKIVDFLRGGIGQDLARLSATFREFAGRVEELQPASGSGGPDHSGQEVAIPKHSRTNHRPEGSANIIPDIETMSPAAEDAVRLLRGES